MGRRATEGDYQLEGEAQRRARILRAAVAVAARHGRDASVAAITKAAGIGRKTFYEFFESKESCFRAALANAIDHLVARVDLARDQQPFDAQGLAEWGDEHRLLLRFCLVEGPHLDRQLYESIFELLARDTQEELVVGAVAHHFYVRVLQGKDGVLSELPNLLWLCDSR